MALTGLALGARHFHPSLEDRSVQLSLVDITVSPPKSVVPSSSGRRAINPRPADRRDEPSPAVPLAPSSTPSPQPGDQEAQAPQHLDLGCYGLPADERAKCEQQRWQAPAQNGPDDGVGPLARLDAGKREALDIIAADQAACLEYKKHINTPMPWRLRDIFKKGLC